MKQKLKVIRNKFNEISWVKIIPKIKGLWNIYNGK